MARVLHPNYQILRDSKYHQSARALMDRLYAEMGDPDGHFVLEFQSRGFHSRLFELGVFAYLESAGFSVDRTHNRPDFLASKDGVAVALEVTAANPTDGQGMDISATGIKPWNQEELEKNVGVEFPRRILSVLTKKLEKRYDLLEHCRGLPLVLAVAPYFEPGSVFHVDAALLPCLFNVPQPEGRRIEPFFSLPGADAICAVLYCNQFTVPRFFRLASTGTFPPSSAFRTGHAYVPDDKGRGELVEYRDDLGAQVGGTEDWAQGVTLFRNPGAALPLPDGLLPCTSEFRVRDDRLIRDVHAFHPLTSTMVVEVES